MHSLSSATADEFDKHRRQGPRISPRRGALLINLGTPDAPSVASVRRYLAEFLSDPAVIQLPRGLRWLTGSLGHLIALFRAPASAKMYETIWTDRGSPLRVITEDQVPALKAALPNDWQVYYAMRYGKPAIAETVKEIVAAGVEELVVVPMYPQFSGSTTGTVLHALFPTLNQHGQHLNVSTRSAWYDDGAYVHAQAKLIADYATAHQLTPDDSFLLFSAHGLPVSYVQRGDPYPRHIRRSVELVVQRLGWPVDRTSLAFQSLLGPVEWIKPSTPASLRELAAGGEKRILICPISFTVDCLETLEEIDVRYRAFVAELGADIFLCPALNTFGPFIAALRDLVLHGPKPVASWSDDTRPLLARSRPSQANAGIDSLVMMGVTQGSRIGPGQGPVLQGTDAASLRRVKRSQCDVPALLHTLRDEGGTVEMWLWNTCNRFEWYGWLDRAMDSADQERALAAIRSHLFGAQEAPGVSVNVLRGTQAWHHLLRTAAGMNSQLPGERDIIDQLEAAHRLARCAGTAGPQAERLLTQSLSAERELRKHTEWGRFEPDYCFASVSRIVASAGLDLANSNIVVIGGSTTSCGVLRTLVGRFEVRTRQLTLLYRGHKRGGNIKMLRKAIGNGRRVRVQSYGEPRVARAIADADVVFFGLDTQQPVVSAEQISRCRDFVKRPLTVIDFNTFQSTEGLSAVEGITLYTSSVLEAEANDYANEMCSSDRFRRATQEAEEWLARLVSASASADGSGDVAATALGEGGVVSARSASAADITSKPPARVVAPSAQPRKSMS